MHYRGDDGMTISSASLRSVKRRPSPTPELVRFFHQSGSHSRPPWRIQSGNLSSRKLSISTVMKTRPCLRSKIHGVQVWLQKVVGVVPDWLRLHSTYTEDSEQQYQRQLKKRGLRKNCTRPGDWEFIGKRTEKRKRIDNKESEVHVCGIELRPEKIQKEKHRAAHVSTMDMFTDCKMKNPNKIVQFSSLTHPSPENSRRCGCLHSGIIGNAPWVEHSSSMVAIYSPVTVQPKYASAITTSLFNRLISSHILQMHHFCRRCLQYPCPRRSICTITLLARNSCNVWPQ